MWITDIEQGLKLIEFVKQKVVYIDDRCSNRCCYYQQNWRGEWYCSLFGYLLNDDLRTDKCIDIFKIPRKNKYG